MVFGQLEIQVNNNYDVYMCRPDKRPTLTVERLKEFMNPEQGTWSEWVDVYSAMRKAEERGYKVPYDMLAQYDADFDAPQRGISELSADLLTAIEKLDSDKKEKPSWLKGLIPWL